MVPRLHPRSMFTTSLFSTTLAVSFLVVGLPHVLPCPVDSRQYTEGPSTQQQIRRRQRGLRQDGADPHGNVEATAADNETAKSGSSLSNGTEPVVPARRGRECPVPKPGGSFGRMLGFTEESALVSTSNPEVQIEQVAKQRLRESERAPSDPDQKRIVTDRGSNG